MEAPDREQLLAFSAAKAAERSMRAISSLYRAAFFDGGLEGGLFLDTLGAARCEGPRASAAAPFSVISASIASMDSEPARRNALSAVST